jgi:cytochrome c-type biogenesis protein CcmH/NrfG
MIAAAMKRDAVALGLSGVFFGLIVGWILGSQRQAPAAPAAAPQAAASAAQAPEPKPIDPQKLAALEAQAKSAPTDPVPRILLGDLYFDAQRFDLAMPWYEAAVALDPKRIDASTDLGICYFYINQVDRALAQFDKSLAIDPNHVKTLLNVGIVRAFGKGDRAGAAQVWERVVAIAPESEEATLAKQGLDDLRGQTGASGAGQSSPPAAGQKGRGGL